MIDVDVNTLHHSQILTENEQKITQIISHLPISGFASKDERFFNVSAQPVDVKAVEIDVDGPAGYVKPIDVGNQSLDDTIITQKTLHMSNKDLKTSNKGEKEANVSSHMTQTVPNKSVTH